MKTKTAYPLAGLRRWRPRRPIPGPRLVAFGFSVAGIVIGLIGASEYEAGDHRFRIFQFVGVGFLWAALAIFFRNEWKKKN